MIYGLNLESDIKPHSKCPPPVHSGWGGLIHYIRWGGVQVGGGGGECQAGGKQCGRKVGVDWWEGLGWDGVEGCWVTGEGSRWQWGWNGLMGMGCVMGGGEVTGCACAACRSLVASPLEQVLPSISG
jgi:hypothetical protein